MMGVGGDPGAVVRDAGADDLKSIGVIYAHHVLNGFASFEEESPDLAEIARRRDGVVALGLPYLVAERAGVVSGFAYAGPFRPRSAYRHTVEDSVYVAPDATGYGLGRLPPDGGGHRRFPKQPFHRAPRRHGIPPDRDSRVDRIQARPLGRCRHYAAFPGHRRRHASQLWSRNRSRPIKGAVTSTAQVLGGNVERYNTRKSPWRAVPYAALQYLVNVKGNIK